MRLYDEIISLVGSNVDAKFMGAFTNLAEEIALAQCFIMSTDVSDACDNVARAKPFSILSAITYLRCPYSRIWVEWRANNQPIGCFIKSTDFRSGELWFVWKAGEYPNICPKSILFDWTENFDHFRFHLNQNIHNASHLSSNSSDKYYMDGLGLTSSLEKANKELEDRITGKDYGMNDLRSYIGQLSFEENILLSLSEYELLALLELERRHYLFINPALHKYSVMNSRNPEYQEFAFESRRIAVALGKKIEAFLLLLNSRNNLIHVDRDDFNRLNASRKKKGKYPLREFTVTKLSITKTLANRARALGITKEMARQHIVRGHFKLRKSGVYWWSPFIRNRGNSDVVLRHHYDAK